MGIQTSTHPFLVWISLYDQNTDENYIWKKEKNKFFNHGNVKGDLFFSQNVLQISPKTNANCICNMSGEQIGPWETFRWTKYFSRLKFRRFLIRNVNIRPFWILRIMKNTEIPEVFYSVSVQSRMWPTYCFLLKYFFQSKGFVLICIEWIYFHENQ